MACFVPLVNTVEEHHYSTCALRTDFFFFLALDNVSKLYTWMNIFENRIVSCPNFGLHVQPEHKSDNPISQTDNFRVHRAKSLCNLNLREFVGLFGDCR